MAGELFDLYNLAGEPSAQEKQAALIQAMKQRLGMQQKTADLSGALGGLGLLTGDKVLGQFGRAQMGDAENLRGLAGQQEGQMGQAGQFIAKGRMDAAEHGAERAFQTQRDAAREAGETSRLKLTLGARDKEAAAKAAADKAEGISKAEEGFRKELNGLPITKETTAMKTSFEGIKSALGANTPAGDMAGIFQFMKVLDPTSSVREGEYANARNTAGVPDQIRNLYNQSLSGKLLNPSQRQDFLGRAADKYKAQLGVYRQFEGKYKKMAEESGANPSRVSVGFDEEPAPDAVQQGSFDAAAPVQLPKDEKEADAAFERLPKGAKYIGPDGKPYTK